MAKGKTCWHSKIDGVMILGEILFAGVRAEGQVCRRWLKGSIDERRSKEFQAEALNRPATRVATAVLMYSFGRKPGSPHIPPMF